MITFKKVKCPQCGKVKEVMLSNNPLSGETICFDCINTHLDYNNLEHAEFFCRSYNLPWMPKIWMSLIEQYNEDTFKEYTRGVLDDEANQPNLAYASSTHDLWKRTNKEWEKCRSFAQILSRLTPIKESYIERGRLKWGEQYNFEELIKLDSIYSRTLKANNITNPLQKESVKTLCKLQIEMDEAIRAKDAKAIKDFSSAWSTFAKQADLETMINETKTDDITTVAELYDFMEKQGFKFKFYDGFDRDEVDFTIKDIQNTLRQLVLESTGLQPLLEQLAKKRLEQAEEEHFNAATQAPGSTLQDLMESMPDDGEIETEVDSVATEHDFNEDLDDLGDDEEIAPKIIRKEN